MYGSDTSQVAALAATGAGATLTWSLVGGAVLIFAGLAAFTIAAVAKHRHKQNA